MKWSLACMTFHCHLGNATFALRGIWQSPYFHGHLRFSAVRRAFSSLAQLLIAWAAELVQLRHDKGKKTFLR